MERRDFIRAGMTVGVAGLGGFGGVVALPELGVARGRRSANDPIRLSSNENPLGVSSKAREAIIEAIVDANRYPGDRRRQLVSMLAEKHGVTEDQIVLGNGSTEILQMCVQAAASPNATLVIADPTFEDVPRYQRPFPFVLEKVPLTADYAHDLQQMRDKAEGRRRPAVVYLCNPNNPTGTLTPSADIDAWIEDAPETTLFIADEAYFEYADDPSYWSVQKWVDQRPNVVVVRTFSKIYGMAGMRLGYAIAHPDMATRLKEFIGANNANQLALAAAMASLKDGELEARSIQVNEQAKQILHGCLDELGLEYLPSHTNFLMHRIAGDLQTYIRRMAEAGIRVGRPFPPMLGYNRLSFGLPEEMEQFADVLVTFRNKGWV